MHTMAKYTFHLIDASGNKQTFCVLSTVTQSVSWANCLTSQTGCGGTWKVTMQIPATIHHTTGQLFEPF